jgi:S-adenosylmethionine-diacylglycerol 3-amino-3-carboxypropyl transferase
MTSLYNYGISQEDALTEYQALDIRPGDRVLCIASAGEIPLNLLAMGVGKIEAVDISAGELALARLKLAASRALEPLEAAAFLGYQEASRTRRGRLLARVSDFLEDEDRRFWSAHVAAVEAGAINVGRFERYLDALRPLGLTLLGRKKLLGLFEEESPEGQRDYFDRSLSPALLRMAFRIAFDPRVYRGRGVAAEGLVHGGQYDAAGFFLRRFRDFCTETPARSNMYLQYVFWKRILFPEALPGYLTPDGMDRVRRHHANLTWRLNSVQQALGEAPPGTFNKIHLSNVGDWMTCNQYAGLLARVAEKAGRPGRVAARYIYLDHPVPAEATARLVRRDELGEQLIGHDRFPFYHLVVMEVE